MVPLPTAMSSRTPGSSWASTSPVAFSLAWRPSGSRMISALSGVGDVLGKYTALADWRIAHALAGESLCPRIEGLTVPG